MMLMTEMPPAVDKDAASKATPTVRKTRCNVAGSGMRLIGPQANPRRIRLTAPGNPVHR